jgi:phage terminase small subunit
LNGKKPESGKTGDIMKKSENKPPEVKWPDPPEYLTEKAKSLYHFYVGKTVHSPGQIVLLIRGLEAMDQADECGRIIRAEGLSQTSERSGMMRQNPLLNTQKEATAQMLKIWRTLRLSSSVSDTTNLTPWGIPYSTET